ncbi:MAG TPA: hypothetical protein VFN03_09775 [Trueperaceae bacterium]|nr:hypothetical protein [Trueperaceae bacterium]
MIGFTNSVTATLNDRTDRLREAAALESLVRAERRATKAAARLAAAMKAAREQQNAFSWESQVHRQLLRQRPARRSLGERLLGRVR